MSDPLKLKAALIYAETLSVPRTAEQIGRSPRTVQRWLYGDASHPPDEEFRRLVLDALDTTTDIVLAGEALHVARRQLRSDDPRIVNDALRTVLNYLSARRAKRIELTGADGSDLFNAILEAMGGEDDRGGADDLGA